ncbi:6-phosphogluconolactonase [Marinobacter litoralis]|uniref:6-phosphogluconolactonase n=2 Tax=Marinobacter litoralis TaxID=187981 RepID=A0A3M2RKW7_9GAMM|nr:6-phosphogluconolactonase [Marinobacter litoralis]
MRMSELQLPEGVVPHLAETQDAVAQMLADQVAECLRLHLAENPEATLVVSGGSTPLPFFRALREKPLEWARVKVALADERWVPVSDPASNAALVQSELLQGAAADARLVLFHYANKGALDALPELEAAAAELPLPIDVLVLGMGNDGHTASLFPDAPELARAMDLSVEQRVMVMTPPSQAHQRVTLTLPVLTQARFTALHLKGQDKIATLARAIEAPADWSAMPIRAFLQAGLHVYWSP